MGVQASLFVIQDVAEAILMVFKISYLRLRRSTNDVADIAVVASIKTAPSPSGR